MVMLNQDFTIHRGQDKILQFEGPGSGPYPRVSWFCAPRHTSLQSEHITDLDNLSGGVAATVTSGTTVVAVTLGHDMTEGWEPDIYHHEAWVEDNLGNRLPWATGKLTVVDSLRG